MAAPAGIGARTVVGRVIGRFLPYRGRVGASAALTLIAVALNIIGPILLRYVIDDGLLGHDARLLAWLCSAMIVVGILTGVLMVAQAALVNSTGQAVVHQLRADLYDRVRVMPLEFFAARSNTEIQARLASDVGGISDILTFSAQAALTAVVGLLAASVVMFLLSWPVAVASLLIAVVLNLLNRIFNNKRRELTGERQEQVAGMLKVVGEDLSLPGVILGRTLGRQEAQRERFMTVSEEIARLTYQQRLAGSSARALTVIMLASLPPVVYWLSGYLGLSIGSVLVLAFMQARLSGPIAQLLSLNGEVQASLAMFSRIFEYLDLVPPDEAGTGAGTSPQADPAAKPIRNRPARVPVPLRARGISCRYAGTENAALSGVELSCAPGSVTLVAGPTGSGKTTLALIMAGLLAPTAGRMELDGRPATAAALREEVTLVAQDSVIFNASIRQNLLFARPDASDADLRAALAAARLGDLLAQLPEGMETVLGERGFRLSGGERQRIALARALLAPCSVLITDEATSALDGVTADLVHQAVRRHAAGRALIIVAHRIPQLAPGDHVLCLEDGRVAERGSYAALQRPGSRFSRLLQAQRADTDHEPPRPHTAPATATALAGAGGRETP